MVSTSVERCDERQELECVCVSCMQRDMEKACVSCGSVEARNVKIKREGSISLTSLRDMIRGFPLFVLREPRGVWERHGSRGTASRGGRERASRLESTFQESNGVFNNTFSYIKIFLLYNKQVGNN